MDGRNFTIFGCLAILAISLFSCQRATTQPAPVQTPYQEEILQAQKNIKQNPKNIDAISELGTLYYKSRQFSKAVSILEKALQLDPAHARSLCYLGLSYEMTGQLDPAMAIYLRYLQVANNSLYRKWLEGRHYIVTREKIKEDIKLLLLQEDAVDSRAVFENTIIVLPFLYHGDDSKYFVLGKGLAEMIINDLSVVEGVKLIDRLQVQALLDEVARRKTLSENVQNSTSLIGRLFHAQTVVRGGFNTIGDEQFILDVAIWDVSKNEIPGTLTYADDMNRVLSLQKDIVENLLESVNIQLPAAAREHIRRIPTENMSAFIAFSAGIAKEDGGEYEEAIVFYKKALELDPNFRHSARKIEENKILALAQRDPDQIILDSDYARSFIQ